MLPGFRIIYTKTNNLDVGALEKGKVGQKLRKLRKIRTIRERDALAPFVDGSHCSTNMMILLICWSKSLQFLSQKGSLWTCRAMPHTGNTRLTFIQGNVPLLGPRSESYEYHSAAQHSRNEGSLFSTSSAMLKSSQLIWAWYMVDRAHGDVRLSLLHD